MEEELFCGILTLKYGKIVAEKFVNYMSNIVVIILTVVSSILIVYFQNVAIFFRCNIFMADYNKRE